MPGHIKKTSGPDPDPSPWLVVSYDLKQKLKQKPYDPKKSVWVPNKADGGYLEGLIESTDGKKVTVNVNGESKVFKEDQVEQVNPPKFDCSDDMAGLTFLGNPCVLWNSVIRYVNELIYTYSGLFCIAINPYKRFPIYTLRTMEMYVGKRRTEVKKSSEIQRVIAKISVLPAHLCDCRGCLPGHDQQWDKPVHLGRFLGSYSLKHQFI